MWPRWRYPVSFVSLSACSPDRQAPPRCACQCACPRSSAGAHEYAKLRRLQRFFWLAVAATREVAEDRFGLREVQHHQSDRRVVHIHQQRAGRRPFLEPSMIAASRSGATRPGTPGAPSAGNLGWTLPARNPQAGSHHQRTNRSLRIQRHSPSQMINTSPLINGITTKTTATIKSNI